MNELLLDLSLMREARDRVDRTYDPGALAGDDLFRVLRPVHLAFDIHKDKDQFHLAGRVATVLGMSCGRCLEPFELPFDEAFDVLYLPHTQNTGEGEREVEDDDLATAFYDAKVIDLGRLMREQFYLAVPMKPLCRVTCRGLCPTCGTNLNDGACACAAEQEDARWAELRKLMKEPPSHG
jgi:uncharacterized protein